MIDPATEAALEAALTPIRAQHPGISNGEAVDLLPEHLRPVFWERAVDRYLTTDLADLEEPQ